jgi:geranylgeranyl diphosphate synthase type I
MKSMDGQGRGDQVITGFLERARADVLDFLDEFLKGKRADFRSVNSWGADATDKLLAFTRSGKMMRAGLVVLGNALAGRRPSVTAVRAAAAVEMIHAGLLIHDDIIDRDPVRRGVPSLHVQYGRQGKALGAGDAAHFGQGMGICLGDIAMFLGFEILSTLPVPAVTRAAVVSLWSTELSRVGLAQMQDLTFGETLPAVTDADIRRVYIYKTARYTFSAPLSTGALLGGMPEAVLRRLAGVGETIGLLFQMRDEELGLYGRAAELGKPIGSDIRESKLTLMTRRLFERASPRDRKRLAGIFGNPCLTSRMVGEVRTIADACGVHAGLKAEMSRLKRRAGRGIAEFPAPEKPKRMLTDILEYTVARRK